MLVMVAPERIVELWRRSGRIAEEKIATVGTITRETRILALNALIEAARRHATDIAGGARDGHYTAADGATVGFALTPGYETYKGLGWYGVIHQLPLTAGATAAASL
jgi:hypothetical protein